MASFLLATTALDVPTNVLLGVSVLLCAVWWLTARRPPGIPPGPGPALPLLGHLYLLPRDPHAKLGEWRRQYGDVFSLYLGDKLVVVLSSYSAIREALVTLADAFSGRPHMFLLDKIIRKEGIGASSGAPWKARRKTAMAILREMGMGKNVMADKIQEEVAHYIKAIGAHQGAAVDLNQITYVSVSNIICSVTMGKRFDYDDPEFIVYLRHIQDFVQVTAGTAILNYLPMLGYLPGDPFQKNRSVANVDAIHGFLQKQVDQHKLALEEGEVHDTDFIFSYLRHLQDLKTSAGDGNDADDGVDSALNEESLRTISVDLFMAGSDTTATTLRWSLLFLLHYPHVQDRCFQDISDVIGQHRSPSISDKPQLPYVEATICEVLRTTPVAPLALPHVTERDVTFRGYVIPRDTVILPNLLYALGDPEVWGDPENFRPERFLSPDGKVIKQDEFIPFSMGRRVCLGESMARMELFLYLATLIQNFRFLPADDGQLPSLQGNMGLVLSPQPYKIRAVPRM